MQRHRIWSTPSWSGCPSVAVFELLALCAEDLQPDFAGPHPVRSSTPVHLKNQSANRAVTGLLGHASGGHDVENGLRQTCELILNPPAEVSVKLAGYQVFESGGLVLLESATLVVDRRIHRPGPPIQGRS